MLISSIDIVSLSDGSGVVVAKYSDEATMEAATGIAQQAFGKLIDVTGVAFSYKKVLI